MLDGVAGSTGREERGIRGVRGETAVATLRAKIARFRQLKPGSEWEPIFGCTVLPEHGPSGLARLGGTI